jgi:predicted metalloenzyme YecM
MAVIELLYDPLRFTCDISTADHICLRCMHLQAAEQSAAESSEQHVKRLEGELVDARASIQELTLRVNEVAAEKVRSATHIRSSPPFYPDSRVDGC